MKKIKLLILSLFIGWLGLKAVNGAAPLHVTTLSNLAPFQVTQVQAAGNITITKRVNVTEVNQEPNGQKVIYEIILQNGDLTYHWPLTLTDNVPAGAICLDTVTNSVQWDQNNAKCRLGLAEFTLARGGVLLPFETIVMQYTVLPNTVEGALLTNQGSDITLIGPDLPTPINGSNDVQTLVHAPTWQITKTVNALRAAPNDILTYQITARNIGSISTSGVFTLTEQLPAALNFVSANLGGSYNPTNRQITWVLNTPVTPNQSVNVSFNAQVSAGANNGDLITNATYWVEGGYAAGQTFGLPAATVTVATPVSVDLQKTVDLAQARAGQTLTYWLTVTNRITSPGPALNLIITDTLPTNTTFVNFGCNVACTQFATNPTSPGFTVGWQLSQPLLPGQSAAMWLKVQINSPMPNGTLIRNSLYGVTSNFPLLVSPTTVPPINTLVVGPANLLLSKQANVTLVQANDVIRYTINLTNTSNEPATQIVLTETVPANTTFSGTGWSCTQGGQAGATCTYNLGTIAANGFTSVDFEVRVVSLLFPPVNPIVNTVAMNYSSANGLPPASSQNTATSAPIRVDVPGVFISPELQEKFGRPGETITYILVVTNTGNSPDNVVIAVTTDKFPLASALGRVFTLTLGSFATRTLQFMVTIPATATYGLTDTIGILAQSRNNLNVTDIATLVTTVAQASDLIMVKLVPRATAQRGETITYSLTYLNWGNATATGVQLIETLPDFTTFVGDTTQWQKSGQQYIFNVGTVPPTLGEPGAVLFPVTIAPNAPVTQIVNTAFITSNSPEFNPANNSNTRIVVLTETVTPQLTLNKLQQNSTPPRPGEIITYSLIYANVGTTTVRNVSLTEYLPTYTTYEGGSSGWQAVGNGQYRLMLGDITPNQAQTPLTFAVRLNSLPASVTQITNMAVIAEASSGAVATTTLLTTVNNPQAAQLTFDKSDGGISTQAGGIIIYILEYANQGGSAGVGVTLQEIVPLYTTFAASASSVGWDCPDGSKEGVICRYSAGNLAAGSRQQIRFAVQVNRNIATTVKSIGNIATLQDTAGTTLADTEDTPLQTPTSAQTVYLPLVIKNPVPAPFDLQITDVTVSNFTPKTGQSVNLYVTLRNNGTQAINTPFWVDLYLATSPIQPTVNQSWDESFNDTLVPYGVVWKVYTLAAGESRQVTNLVPNDPFDLNNNYSNFIPSGLGHWPQTWKGIPLSNTFRQPGQYYLYVLVDSLGGAVSEGNETNNLYGPVIINVSGSALRDKAIDVPLLPLTGDMERPSVQP